MIVYIIWHYIIKILFIHLKNFNEKNIQTINLRFTYEKKIP